MAGGGCAAPLWQVSARPPFRSIHLRPSQHEQGVLNACRRACLRSSRACLLAIRAFLMSIRHRRPGVLRVSPGQGQGLGGQAGAPRAGQGRR